MGYVPTKANPDVWLCPAVKADGFEYYELVVLCYVDDILSISATSEVALEALTGTFTLKDNKIEQPEMYLGAQLGQMDVDGATCWTMSAKNSTCLLWSRMLRRLSPRKGYGCRRSVIHIVCRRGTTQK